MASFGLKMNILLPNINQNGLKGLSFKVRHKPYADRQVVKKLLTRLNLFGYLPKKFTNIAL